MKHSPKTSLRLQPPPRVLIVEARYYPEISNALLAGARASLASIHAVVETITVSGALEIPPAIAIAHAGQGGFEGYVALGCVIRGETTHYDTVAQQSAQGLMNLSVQHALAIGNGILTVENEAQALERALPAKLNKGGHAARACLELIALQRKFKP
jgi:6,7-dimethyl-8-ribityllumazine synthase